MPPLQDQAAQQETCLCLSLNLQILNKTQQDLPGEFLHPPVSNLFQDQSGEGGVFGFGDLSEICQ